MAVAAKICGISEPLGLQAAVEGGARWVGFVFYPRSPRFVAPPMAAELARLLPTGVRSVGLFVDADDAALDQVVGSVPLDMLQLHGGEMPVRVTAIKQRFSMPVMKAIKVRDPAALEAARRFEGIADRLLFDAPPPDDPGALPGGNGVPFDWGLLAGATLRTPWMLSGGLTPENVAAAVAATGATAVDVSSGVEDRPGHKDPDRIRRFLKTVAAL